MRECTPEGFAVLARASPRGAAWAVLIWLTVAAALADSTAASIVFEITHRGGFGPRNPDPWVTLRVQSDGRMGCHCLDGHWAQGRLTEPELDRLRQRILGSDLF